MPQIQVSICVPTWNRAPQLEWLLDNLVRNQSQLQNWQIVVSDNASVDSTPEVCEKYRSRLPMKVLRQKENVGANNNLKSAIDAANGLYCVYLADDDLIDLHVLSKYLDLLREMPNIGTLYAPWNVVDKNQKKVAQFYIQPTNHFVKKGDFSSAATFVIENAIFPEIYIVKKDIYKQMMKTNGIAYDFYVWLYQAISAADVAFASEPYYQQITEHPKGLRSQIQAGVEQTMTSWDLYRGGLEVLLGAAVIQQERALGYMKRSALNQKIDSVICDRMIVAMRLCINMGHFLRGYWLYRRLLATTSEATLPIGRGALIYLAALEYSTDDLIVENALILIPEKIPKELREFICSTSGGKYIDSMPKNTESNLNLVQITAEDYNAAVQVLSF
jgi:glycosyltransferase involved in cell wall biosynthesis